MRLRDQVIGTLNLFRSEPDGLDPAVARAARALVDVATIGILQERAVRQQELVAGQLQAALNSRVMIEQAKGILAERLQTTPDEAFVLLRRYARDHNRPLTALVGDVIQGTADITRGGGRAQKPPPGRGKPDPPSGARRRPEQFRRAGSGRRVRRGAGRPPDGVEVAQRLGVGAHQAGLAVGQALLLAELPDQGLGAAQVGPGHGGEQVVLDLVVQAAQGEVGEPAAADVAGGEHLAAQEVAPVSRRPGWACPCGWGRRSMPRYRPNRPCWTRMNTTALTGESTRKTTVR